MKKKIKSYSRNKFNFYFWLSIFIFVFLIYIHIQAFKKNYNSQLLLIDQPAIATITYKQNNAQRRLSDRTAWDRLKYNSLLYNGDTIYTAEDSQAVITFTDGTRLSLGENSMTQIFIDKEKSTGASLIEGTVLIDTSEGNKNFAVSSKSAILKLESGSKAVVQINRAEEKDDSTFEVSVVEGAAYLQSDNEKENNVVQLLKGHTAAVTEALGVTSIIDSITREAEKAVNAFNEFTESGKNELQKIENSTVENFSYIKELVQSVPQYFSDEKADSKKSEKNTKASKSANSTNGSKTASNAQTAKKSVAAEKKYDTEIDRQLVNVKASLSFVEDLAAFNKKSDAGNSIKFTWRGVRGASDYLVKVFDEKGKLIFYEVIPYSEGILHEANCSISVNKYNLKAGCQYQWSVQAFKRYGSAGKWTYESKSLESVSSFVVKN